MIKQLYFVLPALVLGSVHIPKKEIAPGVLMPVISIGTGGLESHNASLIVRDWMELGGRGVDTAQLYKDQTVVAKAIADAGVDRKDVFITSKVPGCDNTKAYVEGDLKQLGVDYIDLLLIHFPWGYDCNAAWNVLEEFHAKGSLRAIGVSNFKTSDLKKLLSSAKVKPAVNQIQLNVLEHDDNTINFSMANGISVEAYSPLGRSGHSGDISGNPAIQSIASNHSVSTYQVAMRWIVQHGHLLTFQSSSQKHQESDADIFNFSLSDDEMSTLDRQATDLSAHPPVIVQI